MIQTNNHTEVSRHSKTGGRLSYGLMAGIIVAAVVIADQLLKFYVKTHFYMGEDVELTSWFHIKFIENNGMAFGWEFLNKYVLTLGRMVAVGFFIWFIYKIKDVCTLHRGFIIAISLITAGAAGNIFDCVLYGELFNNPIPPEIATALPYGGGYAGWFEGRVVDMLYFPFFTFTWPEWIPIIGGREFEFFQYIFNIADAAICIGVMLLIFFYSYDFKYALSILGINNTEKSNAK
jgi:signal peptidase II